MIQAKEWLSKRYDRYGKPLSLTGDIQLPAQELIRMLEEYAATAPVPVLARPQPSLVAAIKMNRIYTEFWTQAAYEILLWSKETPDDDTSVNCLAESLKKKFVRSEAAPLRSEEPLSRELVEKIQWTMRELAGAAGSHHSDAQQKYEESWHRLEELVAAPPLRSEEPLNAKEWASKEFWPKQPKCLGYEGGCDGDLEGLEHEKNCPMFGKQPVNILEFAEAYAAYVAALASRTSSEPRIANLIEKYELEIKRGLWEESTPGIRHVLHDLKVIAGIPLPRASAPRTESLAKTYEAMTNVYEAAEEESMGPRELSPPDQEFELGEKISCGSAEGRASNTPTACTDAEGDKHHSGYQAPPAGTQPTAAGGEQGEKSIDK